MKLKHWKLGTVLLGVLILLCLVWWPERETPKPIQSVTTMNDASAALAPEESLSSGRRQTYRDECAACPDIPLAEGMKRAAPPEDRTTDRACRDLLRESAAIGNPEPSLSHLGGCEGKTPLHYASTSEQVQLLLDNGADPNIRDHYGRTPISRQVTSAVVSASEEKIAIIQTLLAAGADPWIKDNLGRFPLQLAQRMNLGGLTSELSLKRMEQRLRLRGVSPAEAEKDPRYIAAMERMESHPRLAARAISELMKGMIKTAPPGVRAPELPEGF